jgi:hypothetical protein
VGGSGLVQELLAKIGITAPEVMKSFALFGFHQKFR